MDLRSLIQQLDTISKKQTLTESSPQPSTVSKPQPTKKSVKNESIKHTLLREFSSQLIEAENPWPAGSEKAQAWDRLTDQDQAALGTADPTDPYILSRMPNQGIPRQLPQTAPEPVTTATPVAPDTTAAAEPLAPLPAGGMASAAPGATGSAGMPATGAAATKPAAVTKTKSDPAVQNVQKQLMALGIGIGATGADGVMGKNTAAGIKVFEKMAGLPETGTITPALLKSLETGAQIKSQSDLTNAITALEKLLKTYNVESVLQTNVNKLSEVQHLRLLKSFLSERGEVTNADPDPRKPNQPIRVSQRYDLGQAPNPAYSPATAGSAPPTNPPTTPPAPPVAPPPPPGSSAGGAAPLPAKPGASAVATTPPPRVEKNMGPAQVVGPKALPPRTSPLPRSPVSRLGKGAAVAAMATGATALGGLSFNTIQQWLQPVKELNLAPQDLATLNQHEEVLKKYYEDPEASAALPKDLQNRLTAVFTKIQKLRDRQKKNTPQ